MSENLVARSMYDTDHTIFLVAATPQANLEDRYSDLVLIIEQIAKYGDEEKATNKNATQRITAWLVQFLPEEARLVLAETLMQHSDKR